MENHDRALILKKVNNNPQVKRLLEKHETLDREVALFSRKKYLTNDEELKLKRLKQEKLHGMDRLMSIIED